MQSALWGPFISLSEFLSRIGSKNLNRKSLESFIKVRCVDSMKIPTAAACSRISRPCSPSIATRPHQSPKTPSLALWRPPTLNASTGRGTVSLKDKLDWERELLGIYVSGHPLDAHANKAAKASVTIGSIKADPKPGLPVILPVLIADVRSILTKNGDKMAFVKLEDKSGSIRSSRCSQNSSKSIAGSSSPAVRPRERDHLQA